MFLVSAQKLKGLDGIREAFSSGLPASPFRSANASDSWPEPAVARNLANSRWWNWDPELVTMALFCCHCYLSKITRACLLILTIMNSAIESLLRTNVKVGNYAR